MNTTKYIGFIVFCFSLVACVGGSNSGNSEPNGKPRDGAVSGTITPASAGVIVNVNNEAGSTVSTTKTNADGSYSASIPNGFLGKLVVAPKTEGNLVQEISFTGENYPRVDFAIPPGSQKCGEPVPDGDFALPPSVGGC